MKQENPKYSKKEELLDPNSNHSMMRWAIYQIIPIICILMMSIPLLVGYQIYQNQTPDWVGIGAFFGGISAIIGTLLGAKAYQKKNE